MAGSGTRRLRRMVLAGMALVFCTARGGAAQEPGLAVADANGTWRLSDDPASGKWTARFQVDADGSLTGTIALTGLGDGTPAEIEGTVDGDQITFGLVSTRADTAAGKQSLCAFEGTLRGARVKGTFSDPQGREGQWEGWWSARGQPAEGTDDAAGATVIFAP